MEAGRTVFGGDVGGGLGVETDGGGGRDGRDRDGDGLHWLEYNVAHVTLRKETNAPLACDPGL